MFNSRVCAFVFMCVCVCSLQAAYAPPVPYSAPVPTSVVSLPENAEAQAAAITNAAGAKAAAAKIDVANWDALNRYGWEIGVPLLVKPYGPLTSLYAASLPPRSLVGKIDPAFVKDSYGGIKFIDQTSIGLVAI